MRIALFGGFEVSSPTGEPIRLATRKTSLLLAALALADDKGVRREVLRESFWADRGEAQARSSLRQALAALRKVFREAESSAIRIESDLERVRLRGPPEDIDVRLFERLAETAEPAALARAAQLYSGDVLLGVALPDRLDQWFDPYQRAYRRKALQVAERLSLAASIADGVDTACAELSERLLRADPAAEEAHRALIRLHQARGRVNAARRQFELCRDALQRELGVAPEDETCILVERPPEVRSPIAKSAPQQVAAARNVPVPAPSARESEQPCVIVMPFDNLSGDADEYFADGVVEEITSALSRVREFFVIARQSAFTYKGRFVDVREVGRELGVGYVVEGTVRRGGDRLRISVQLVDAPSRRQLWSERYEGATTDVFVFQDRIAAQVAGAISPAVRNAEIDFAGRKPPESLRAYDFVLRAYPKIWSNNAEENRQAIASLTEATAIDPKYGRAHALLAWCHSQEAVYLWTSDPEPALGRARAAIDIAAGLIGDDPTAMTAVGAALSQCVGDQERAASYIEKALTLDPSNAWAWGRYGWLALYRDDSERAKERFERALELSPFDPLEFNLRIGIAVAVGIAGEYGRAVKMIREVLNRHPQVTWANRQLAAFSALAGDLPGARDAIARLLAAHPNTSVTLMKAINPIRHAPRLFGLMLQGWRLAGLPEG